MIDEPTKPITLEEVDNILRSAIPMLVKTKGVAEYAFAEMQKLALMFETLQSTVVRLDRLSSEVELKITELESRLDVASSWAKGAKHE